MARNTLVSFRAEPDQRDRLDAFAARAGHTRSAAAALLIEQALRGVDEAPPPARGCLAAASPSPLHPPTVPAEACACCSSTSAGLGSPLPALATWPTLPGASDPYRRGR